MPSDKIRYLFFGGYPISISDRDSPNRDDIEMHSSVWWVSAVLSLCSFWSNFDTSHRELFPPLYSLPTCQAEHGLSMMNPPTLRTSVLSERVMHDFCWALLHSSQPISKVQHYPNSKTLHAKSLLIHQVTERPTGNKQSLLSAFFLSQISSFMALLHL